MKHSRSTKRKKSDKQIHKSAQGKIIYLTFGFFVYILHKAVWFFFEFIELELQVGARKVM